MQKNRRPHPAEGWSRRPRHYRRRGMVSSRVTRGAVERLGSPVIDLARADVDGMLEEVACEIETIAPAFLVATPPERVVSAAEAVQVEHGPASRLAGVEAERRDPPHPDQAGRRHT